MWIEYKKLILDSCGDGEYDLSSFKEIELIRIHNRFNKPRIQLPTNCHQVIIEGNVSIQNIDEITIQHLERYEIECDEDEFSNFF